MKQLLRRNATEHSCARLMLFFAGWGMDPTPFEALSPSGYDVMVVWDYRDEEFNLAALTPYGEIVIAGWSFGVFMASRFMARHPELLITLTIAVNGTLHPIDSQLGIPPHTFNGTLENLNERNLRKFYRRMFATAEEFKAFNTPQRDIIELRQELEHISQLAVEPATMTFEKVFISDDDRIIPTANQHNLWGKTAITVGGGHWPDNFISLLNQAVVDKELVKTRFRRGMKSYNDNAVAQKWIAERLMKILPADASLKQTIEIGSGSGLLTKLLLSHERPYQLIMIDMAATPPEEIRPLCNVEFRQSDAETEITTLPDGWATTIASSSTIQWFNSPARFLQQCSRVLAPKGYALLSTFSPDNFSELKPYRQPAQWPSMESLLKLVPPDMETIEAIELDLPISFETPAAMLRHMKLTGVNALTQANGAATARKIMRTLPSPCTLTYKPILLLLRKK